MYMKPLKYYQNTLDKSLLYVRNVLSGNMVAKIRRIFMKTLMFSGIIIIAMAVIIILLFISITNYIGDRF